MKYLSPAERSYCKKHLAMVRHITLDPKGPGVVRMHLIPPRASGVKTPYLLLVNGAQLVPLRVSWAILLANFMDAVTPLAGLEITPEQWQAAADAAVAATRRTYKRTKAEIIRADLDIMLDALVDIAQGRTPAVAVGGLTLGEYAPHMTAPHRMDLMVSAMTRDGCWHCNQKCLHCYAAGQPMAETGELDTNQWRTVLDKLRAANIPQVTFTGGEPTLRPDLVDLVEAAQWFVTRLNTNGRLLTPSLCRRLYDASLDSVQVTLYSHRAEVHNTLVGADGFADTVQGILNAVEAGLNVSVNTPLCSLNADYDATLRFVHGLGVRYATCSGLIPAGGAETSASLATRLTEAQLTESLRAGMEAARTLEMEVDFTSPGWLPEATLRNLGFGLIPSCGACLSNMAIAPDGTVVPCQSWLGGVTMGNILTDRWDRIWNQADCVRIREKSARMEQLCQLRTGNTGREGC